MLEKVFIKVCIALSLLFLLAGCGVESAKVEEQPDFTEESGGTTVIAYSGADHVERFKTEVWDNLRELERCGECHSEVGRTAQSGQSPMFVEYDSSSEAEGAEAIERSYDLFINLIDVANVSESEIITKVTNGHNCWLSSDTACGDVMVRWIDAMLATAVTGDVNEIELTAPAESRDVTSALKLLPDDNGVLFDTHLYGALKQYCAECHSDTATTPQAPYFASDTLAIAYDAVKSKIDLASTDQAAEAGDYRLNQSRLVFRLGNEFHNCWSDCAANAEELHNLIKTMSDNITAVAIDPTLLVSKALTLYEGVQANSGGRYEESVIALYEFKEGQGSIANDTSGVSPEAHLNMVGDYEWVGGWGVKLNQGFGSATVSSSKKLFDEIRATGKYSVEAWVIPGNVTQDGPAEIISYSAGTDDRNFTVGQTLYNYNFLNRNSVTGVSGEPALSTADADERLQATLQHIVMTYDGSDGRKIYVNGEFTEDSDPAAAGTLSDWDDSYALMIGSQLKGWQGTVKFLAIHNAVLTEEQVGLNYNAGVGEKFFLMFDVSSLVGLSQSYIVIEGSQFDTYGYLFNAPFFISLDSSVEPTGIDIEGMRIGLNSKEVEVGQAYANIDVILNADDYTPEAGQLLSSIGTVIALEEGPGTDEFFLTFDKIGTNEYARTESAVLTSTDAGDPATIQTQYSDIGLRTFNEINLSMAEMTGVSSENSTVKATYTTVKQQLPSTEDIETFLASHQMAITQMAISYCSELVESSTLRDAFFTGVDFSQGPSAAYDTSGLAALNSALATHFFPRSLATQPTNSEVSTEIDSLVAKLSTCSGDCTADRTATIAKASCAAVLGSAVMLLQ